MTLRDNAVYRSLDRLKATFQTFGSFLTKVGGVVAGAGSAVLAPLTGMFFSTIEKLDELNKAADRLGTTTEALSRLGFAGKFAGLSIEDLEAGAKHLEKTIAEAAAGSSEAADALGRLGLSAEDLINLPLDEQFARIADAFDGVERGADRVALAMKVAGKSGSALLPLLKGGGGGLRSRFAQAEELGFVASGEKAEQATRAVDAFELVQVSLKKTLGAAGAAFLPFVSTIELYADKFARAAADARKFVKDNFGVITVVALVAAGMVAAGTAVVGLGLAFTLAGTAIGAAVVVMKAAAAALVLLTSTPAIVAAAIATMGFAIVASTEEGRRGILGLGDGLMEALDTAKTALAGIADAVQAGDLGLAMRIAGAALKLEWAKVVAFWTDQWNAFKGLFVDGWHQAVSGVAILLSRLATNVEKIFESIGTAIGNVFRFIAEKALDMAIAVAEALDALDPTDSLKGAIDFAKGLREQVGGAARDAARAERDAKLAELDRQQTAVEAAIREAHAAEQRAREASRAADAGAARAEIARLQKELTDLREQAARANAPQGNPLLAMLFGSSAAAVRALSRLPKPGDLVEMTRGSFDTTAASRRFGAGDTVGQKIEKNTSATADGVQDVAKTLDALVAAFRFK